MPAETEELEWLFEEGNKLIELASPTRVILEDGRVTALECVRNELGEPGPDGRRRPLPVAGSEFRIEASAIILAIGQKPDLAFLDGTALTFHGDGRIMTDPDSRITDHEGVYAGGDVTRGPEIIIAACEDGRRAAEAICEQFSIEFRSPFPGLPELAPDDILQVKQARVRKVVQHEPQMLPVAQRTGFACVEQTLSEQTARAEAARCLQCSTFCDKCVEVCPNRANYTYQVSPLSLTLPQVACQNGDLVVVGQESFQVEQTRQIVHVDDFCNECGNCATFCVHQGKPYSDKPRLFLKREDFQSEDDNAYYLEGDTIWRREGGQESRLSLGNGLLTFENAQMRLHLTPDFVADQVDLKQPFEGTVSLKQAAEMYVILEGVAASAPFLLA